MDQTLIMAEIKNTFLRSKMNKDLDARLVPNGEYRQAQNININKSEGDDVGAIENILGNTKITDFGLLSSNGEVIGSYHDDNNEKIYAFITNYHDSSLDTLTNNCAAYPTYSVSTGQGVCCALVQYDLPTNSTSVLLFGTWLNLSKTHPVSGINLIENQFFWTDNRNQPRKINIDRAIAAPYDLTVGNYNNPYYTNEDQISVAKYYPYKSIDLYKNENFSAIIISGGTGFTPVTTPWTLITNLSTLQGSGTGMIVSAYVSDGTVGVAGSLADVIITNQGSGYQVGDILEVGDESAGSNATIKLTGGIVGTMKDVVSQDLPTTVTANPASAGSYSPGTNILLANVVGTLNQKWTGATIRVVDPTGFGSNIPDNTLVTSASANSITLSNTVNLASTSSQIVIGANPYFDPNYQGDQDVLREEFVKFAYRFQFDDNEYSLISPFTQSAFIPTQWGYFLGSDFIDTYQSTLAVIMENLVNQIEFQIPAPDKIDQTQMNWSEVNNLLKIKSVELLWKSASQTSFKVLDVLTISDFGSLNTSIFPYKYVCRKPIRTLPESDITRVSDKVPLRAKTQETSGNRIIYGNIVQTAGRPEVLPYNVSIDDKYENQTGGGGLEIFTPAVYRQEYPNHTVKQNRTYQVGIILVDRYGRQSDVILSSNDIFNGTVGFQGSTVFHNYRTSGQPLRALTGKIWPGDSIKCLFTNVIPETNSSLGYLGLYKSNQSNPLGWYTFKIVVKQQQQDYYNVYLPGILNNYPQIDVVNNNVTSETVANVVLLGDNINKVPRELQDVGPEQRQFASDVDLFGRVNSDIYGASSQFYPNKKADTVNLIGTYNDLNYNKTNPGIDGGDAAGVEWISFILPSAPSVIVNPGSLSPFYNVPGNGKSDGATPDPSLLVPFGSGGDTLIGRISTSKAIGLPGGGGLTLSGNDGSPWSSSPANVLWYKKPSLSVYETTPVSSNLDIYFETSTGGKISSLNTAILNGDIVTPIGLQDLFFNYNESFPPLQYVTNSFRPLANGPTILNNPNTLVSISSVVDGNGANVDLFEVERDNSNNTFRLKVKTNRYNVFLDNSPTVDNYTFNFVVSNVDGSGNTISSNITINPPNLMINTIPGWSDNGGSLGPPASTGGAYYGGVSVGWPFSDWQTDVAANPIPATDPSRQSPFNAAFPGQQLDINRSTHRGTYLDPLPSMEALTFISSGGAGGWNYVVSLNAFNGSYATGAGGTPYLIKQETVWEPLDLEFWWTGRINGTNQSEPAWESLKNLAPNGGLYASPTAWQGQLKNQTQPYGSTSTAKAEIPSNGGGGNTWGQNILISEQIFVSGTPSTPGNIISDNGFLRLVKASDLSLGVGSPLSSIPGQENDSIKETLIHRLRGLAHWYSELNNVYAAYPASVSQSSGNTNNPIYNMTALGQGAGLTAPLMPQGVNTYDYQRTSLGSGNTYYPAVAWPTNLPPRPYLGNVTPPAASLPTNINHTLYRVTMKVSDAGGLSNSLNNTLYIYFYVSNSTVQNEKIIAPI